jgi:hypothetical protein
VSRSSCIEEFWVKWFLKFLSVNEAERMASTQSNVLTVGRIPSFGYT